MRKRKRGFTLVEMLVAIGIIALLMAIGWPVMASARARARRTQCVSNLRQIGMAVNMYADNHEGFFPFASVMPSTEEDNGMGRICDRLAPYTSPGLFECPSDRATDPKYLHGSYFEGEGSSYEWAEILNGMQSGEKLPFRRMQLNDMPAVRDYEPFHRDTGSEVGMNAWFVDGRVESF